MGLSFVCPVHRTHRLAIFFVNPIDGGPPATAQNLWHRNEETFDALTLGPSIDASGNTNGGQIKTPCWHGFIHYGQVI